jgi:hypothetical protein
MHASYTRMDPGQSGSRQAWEEGRTRQLTGVERARLSWRLWLRWLREELEAGGRRGGTRCRLSLFFLPLLGEARGRWFRIGFVRDVKGRAREEEGGGPVETLRWGSTEKLLPALSVYHAHAARMGPRLRGDAISSLPSPHVHRRKRVVIFSNISRVLK